MVQLVENEKQNLLFYKKKYGGLYYKNILWVPKVQEMKKKLMYESHNIIFTMHPGGNKMY